MNAKADKLDLRSIFAGKLTSVEAVLRSLGMEMPAVGNLGGSSRGRALTGSRRDVTSRLIPQDSDVASILAGGSSGGGAGLSTEEAAKLREEVEARARAHVRKLAVAASLLRVAATCLTRGHTSTRKRPWK